MTELLHAELTEKIIGAYYNVYNSLGHTYPEYVYESALIYELQLQGIPCQRQDEYSVFYKEKMVGSQRFDLFVANEVVVELKVTSELTPLHWAQTFSYLKTLNKRIALLVNFGETKPCFKRLILPERPQPKTPTPDINVSDLSPNLISPEIVYQVIGGLYEVHAKLGPGFIYRIYANAAFHELQLRGLPVRRQHHMQFFYRQHPIAKVNFAHIEVGSDLLIFPVAITDLNQISFNNIKDWLHIQQRSLAIIANFYDVSLKPFFLRI